MCECIVVTVVFFHWWLMCFFFNAIGNLFYHLSQLRRNLAIFVRPYMKYRAGPRNWIAGSLSLCANFTLCDRLPPVMDMPFFTIMYFVNSNFVTYFHYFYVIFLFYFPIDHFQLFIYENVFTCGCSCLFVTSYSNCGILLIQSNRCMYHIP